MATVPPKSRSLTANVLDFARRAAQRKISLTEPQKQVAAWLRGNKTAIESLRLLLTARTEGRALSPIPSDPKDALVDKARDYEARSILAELDMIAESPLPNLHDTGEQE